LTAVAVVLFCVAAALPSTTAAQPPPLTSNRPGIGESEALVPARSVQIEAGTTVARSAADGVLATLVTTPEATVRYGIAPRVEVFAGARGLWLRERAGGQSLTTRGLSDLAVDLKVGLLDAEHAGATVSLAGGVTLPTGAGAFTSDAVDGSVRLLWSAGLPAEFSLSGNAGVSGPSTPDGRTVAGLASISLSRPLSDRAGWFVELFDALGRRSRDVWTTAGGIAVVAGETQLDVSAGRAVRGGAGDWFVSAGLTVRYRPGR
jgi:hypothetical protein